MPLFLYFYFIFQHITRQRLYTLISAVDQKTKFFEKQYLAKGPNTPQNEYYFYAAMISVNKSLQNLLSPLNEMLKNAQKENLGQNEEVKIVSPVVGNNKKLLNILNTLKTNISNYKNGRKTNRNRDWKVDLLLEIKDRLVNEEVPENTNILQYIEDIRNVCAKKRNPLHFWAEPHSVNEFEVLLEKTGLNGQQEVIEDKVVINNF